MFSIFLLLIFSFPTFLSQDISFPSHNTDEEDSILIENLSSPLAQSAVEYQPLSYENILADGVTDLGLSIDRIGNNADKNWEVYSPTSIGSALYMVLLGSNGKTQTELSKTLGIPFGTSFLKPHQDFGHIIHNIQNTGNQNNIITLANGLFVQTGYQIRKEFKQNSETFYQAEMLNLDFKNNGSYARNVINKWVSLKTLGKISSILSDNPSPETRIIIANSLYFKGEWAKPFPSPLTKLQPFYPNGKSQPSTLKVPIMAQQDTYRYYDDKELNCEIVGIPYKGETIIFYLILPRNSSKQTLQHLQSRLQASNLNRLFENAILTHDVLVALPKMRLTSYYLLNKRLKDLGLQSIFNPTEADLSRLAFQEEITPSGPSTNEDSFSFPKTRKVRDNSERLVALNQGENKVDSGKILQNEGNPGLYVNQVLHRVVIDVNEEGTEAAATTLVAMTKTVSHIVKADVPFLFFIRHEPSKMILFWGAVSTPPV